jgi:DNA-binding GntR family transcriptional regulator
LSNKNKPIPHLSLVDRVAARLRSDILRGALKPGQQISVPQLVNDWGVSHIPIREALRRLEAERLLETRPHRRPVVAAVDPDDLRAIYDMRRLIEGHLIRRAATLYTDDQIEHIGSSLEWLLASDPESTEDFWTAHHDFHRALLSPSLDPWSRQILELLWQSAERYHRLFALVFGSVQESHVEHRELARAAADRDADRLHEALMAHLNRTEQAVTAGYRDATAVPDTRS